jgi:hypothetical protein
MVFDECIRCFIFHTFAHSALVKTPAVYENITKQWDTNCRMAFLAALFMDELAPEASSTTNLCTDAKKIFFKGGPIDVDGDGMSLLKVYLFQIHSR